MEILALLMAINVNYLYARVNVFLYIYKIEIVEIIYDFGEFIESMTRGNFFPDKYEIV